MAVLREAGIRVRLLGRILPLLFLAAPLAAQVADARMETNFLHGQYLRGHVWRGGIFNPPFAAPAGARLVYWGGRVISNAQVVIVLYGTGNFLPQVAGTAAPSLATFFQAVLNSAYMDWLTEYNTPTSGGTNQHIGRGSFLQQIAISPSSANNGATIDDSNIQAELDAQIGAGRLPAPTRDAAGNTNTVYMIYFPHGKVITQGGASSCASGGFCAYHGTIRNSAHGEYFYGVFPDMQAGSGCDTGCGSSTPFGNYTSVASHELIEAITDAEVGLATALAAPLAWYDNTNGEIGDICNAQQGTIVGGDGVTYVVQKEFSNVANDCIVSRTMTNDFSISVSPGSLTVQQGASGTMTVSTAIVSGSAQPVTLSVAGQPPGVAATFSQVSVTAGGSSTLTLAASSSTTAGTFTLTVTGTAASGSHTAASSLTVTSMPPPSGGITNGNFETGSVSGWTATGASVSVVNAGCHGGAYCARLGNTTATNGDSSLSQTFTAPANATGIAFWYKETCPDTVTYDWALASLKDNTAGTTSSVLSKACVTNAWTQVNTTSVAAGHSYTLTFTSHDDNYSSDPTYTLFDDVALTTGVPPAGGITNGGFESGVSGWTTSGTTSIVAAGCHGGASCARAGSSSPTNGDSGFAQTFTVPPGKSQLSIWRRSTCPDTVTYDWATITLKDNTAGTTAAVLPKTCATNTSWINNTVPVVAGHSYTLTLTSHDDNYTGDATFTLFDDVVLN